MSPPTPPCASSPGWRRWRRRPAALLLAWACTGLAACPSAPGTSADMAAPGSDAGPSPGASLASLTSLTIWPADATIERGATQTFTVTGVFTDGAVQDLTTRVKWSAVDLAGAGVAIIDAAGIASGTAPAEAEIQATYQDRTARARLHIVASPLLALALSPSKPTVAIGTTHQISVSAIYADGTRRDVTGLPGWRSTDLTGRDVVRVNSSGLVTATAPGEALVTATFQDKVALTTFKVSAATLASLVVTPGSPKAAPGMDLRFRAVGTFTDATQQDLTAQATWTTGDTGVAPAPRTGLVTAKARGTTAIGATVLGKSSATVLTVLDATISSIAITPAAPVLPQSGSQQLTATSTFSDGSTQDVTPWVLWRTVDFSTSVALVGATGLVTGVSGGTVDVTALYGVRRPSVPLTVSGTAVPVPALTTVTPPFAPTTGGTLLELVGTGFTTGDTVRVGTQPATDVTVRSPTRLSARVPAALGSYGPVPIVVTHTDGQSVSRGDLFAYAASTPGFGAATAFATGAGPSELTTGDWNKDGRLDLAVVNAGDGSVSILLGTGTGGFGAATAFATGASPRSIASGDWNGDGVLDLAVANAGDGSVSILLGTGAGGFVATSPVPGIATPVSIVAGDWNNDGKADLAAAQSTMRSVVVLLGSGTGTFTATAYPLLGTAPSTLLVTDLNGDRNADLIVGHGGPGALTVDFLRGKGDGTFDDGRPLSSLGDAQSGLAAGDVNGDLRLDLVVACPSSGQIRVLPSNRDGGLGGSIVAGSAPGPRGLLLWDLDGDGKLDVVSTQSDDKIGVRFGKGDGSFGAVTTLAVGKSPVAVVAGDFNGDKKPDLVAVNSDGNSVSVLLSTAQ